jgi:hypothetical protein
VPSFVHNGRRRSLEAANAPASGYKDEALVKRNLNFIEPTAPNTGAVHLQRPHAAAEDNYTTDAANARRFQGKSAL